MNNLAANHTATPLPLITKASLHGPLTQKLRSRTLRGYLCLVFIGVLFVTLTSSTYWQVFGLGLMFPGSGFLAADGWGLLFLPLSLVLFLVAMGAWLFTGNLMAPLFLWLGLAFLAPLAASSVAQWQMIVAVGLPLLLILLSTLSAKKKLSQALQKQHARNSIMQSAFDLIESVAEEAPSIEQRELSEEDLSVMRYLFDLSLQPLGKFEGFVRKDNFQPAALRYQMNHIQYTLGVMQCHYTPNFHGYLNQAQRYTIDSLALPEVCGYWKLESVWGNFTWNPDPIDTKDNIMMTGWSGLCLGTYALNTGDKRYLDNASLDFRPFKSKSKPSYPHNHHDFIQSMLNNWNKADYFLFPCEPNFIYAQCNLYGYNALKAYDNVCGTHHTDAIKYDFEKNMMAEFELADGNIQPILSSLTGLPFLFKPSLVANLSNVHLINAMNPELAKRIYGLARVEDIKISDTDELILELTSLDSVDPGNYSKSTAFTLSWIAVAAAEMGDRKVAELALERVEKEYPLQENNGSKMIKDVSVITAADYALARITRKDFWKDSINIGPAKSCLEGPILTDCQYPDVLVAKAISKDGKSLDLVLYNGRDAGPQPLKIDRLIPNQTYQITSTHQESREMTADELGCLTLQVNIAGRTVIGINPTTH